MDITSDGDTIISDYEYDTQGRLESYVQVVYKPTPILSAYSTYTYGDHCIIEKNGNIDYTYYTLNDDGLIIQMELREEIDKPSKLEFTYQYADGRLIAYQDPDLPLVSNVHWEDGDLMYFGRGEREDERTFFDRTEFTRTQLSVDHGYMIEPLGTGDEPLYMMGYYGKPSKHLESHSIRETRNNGSSSFFEFDYTYTLADGHIVKLVKKRTMKRNVPMINITSTTTSIYAYEEYQ